MNERNEPVDPRHEDALSRALHAEAESVRPAGDGLIRIRSRVERRSRRNRWLAPAATAAAVAATVTGVASAGLFNGSTNNSPQALPTLTLASKIVPTTTAAPTTTPVVRVVPAATTGAATEPAVATTTTAATVQPSLTTKIAADTGPPSGPTPVWPFANAAAAATWQKTAANSADQWHLDAKSTAEHFVTSLGLPQQQLTVVADTASGNATGDVTLATLTTASGKPVTFGIVHLSHWGTGADAPWGVGSVTTSGAAITAPTPSATTGSSLPVSFTLNGGSEEDITVQAWRAGDQAPLASDHVVSGADGKVTLEPELTASAPGFVVVADVQGASGTSVLSRLAVTPVQLQNTAGLAAGQFVTVSNGVLALQSGLQPKPSSTLAAGVTAAQVSEDRRWVYFLQGATCSSKLMREQLGLPGAKPEQVTTAAGPITAFGIGGPEAESLTYVTTECPGGAQTIQWRTAAGPGSLGSFSTGMPYAQSVAISPDGTQVSAFIKTGMQGNISTYLLPAANDSTNPPGCQVQGCIAEAYASDGDLVYVFSDGQKLTVNRVHAGSAIKLFAVTASSQSATVDLNASGSSVLLTDGAGHGWMWTGSGEAKALATAVTDASW
jgi:hypothetical protein